LRNRNPPNAVNAATAMTVAGANGRLAKKRGSMSGSTLRRSSRRSVTSETLGSDHTALASRYRVLVPAPLHGGGAHRPLDTQEDASAGYTTPS
jgi:hypothetical protein